MVDLQRYRATSGERNFFGGSFSNRNNVRAPIQFGRESQPQYLKISLYSRKDPTIFTTIASVFLDQSNKTSQVFPALKSTSHLPPQSTVSDSSLDTVSTMSDSSSDANSSCCHRSDA